MSQMLRKVQKYLASTSQFPFLIAVDKNNRDTLVQEFSQNELLRTSSFCVGSDKNPDIDKLFQSIKAQSGKCLLLGYGEYALTKADNNEKRQLLTRLVNQSLQYNVHIVCLLPIALSNLLEEMLKIDLRIRNRIAISDIGDNLPICLTTTSSVDGIKAYLEHCENGENPATVKTQLPIASARTIKFGNIFHEIKIKFPIDCKMLIEEYGTKEEWTKLGDDLKKSKLGVKDFFATKNYQQPELEFYKLFDGNTYDSWLYFLHLKTKVDNNIYLQQALDKANTVNELIEFIKNGLLEFVPTHSKWNELYQQRKALLKMISDAQIAGYTKRTVVKGKDRIAYLTDNTIIERRAIIEAICEGADKSYIESVYPDLFYYLQGYNFQNETLNSYFKQYIDCKISNVLSDQFIKKVQENAINRIYNSFPTRTNVLSKLDDGCTKLIFIDAMGLEYLGYIQKLCEKSGNGFKTTVVRSDLPTVTSTNKQFYNDWKGPKVDIKSLDDLKHHPEKGYDYNNCSMPIHIAEELKVIFDAIERSKIALLTGECNKIVITADHGASRLSVIAPTDLIASGDCESKSNGRYCIGNTLPVAEYIAHEGNNAILGNYCRFDGSRTGSVEVHGGATLEEVLVPVIEILTGQDKKDVKLESEIIEVSAKEVPSLIFYITPYAENIKVAVDGKYYCVIVKSSNKFSVSLEGMKRGTYNLDVYEGDTRIAVKSFTIKGKGLSERSLF